ncbi:MAG: PDZ domain-containing protein, partial [Vicinamibacteria bacterium]|nr:PDZ domain-containing protein [Vicinamibacteria bacterium]
VILANERRYEAKLIGRDARTDVALVKIEPREPLTVLPLGDSDKAEVGEWVMAIGNPFGLGNSVTVGVVSFKGRPLVLGVANTRIDMIQTDAAINPGNSGGPLLNSRGEVIGINTLIITRGAPQSSGVGFAVPINVARSILPQLREKGRVVRGWLGVAVRDLDEDLAKTFGLKDAKGAVVQEVTAGSPADRAGVQAEDLIVRIDEQKIESSDDLVGYVTSHAPGSNVAMHLVRGGAPKTITITLGTFPDEEEQPDGERGRKGQLGMSLRDLTPRLADQLDLPRNLTGVVIMETEPGEAADEAGLQKGDLILAVNGQAVDSVAQFDAQIAQSRARGAARLRIQRGRTQTLVVLQLK